MRSATADSNVLVSALNYAGAAARLLGLARVGVIRLDISEAILNETLGVLRDKFGWEGYRLHFARQEITNLCNVVAPVRILEVVKHDPEDNRVLECAEAAGSEFIVTGDQDLLRLKASGAVRIVKYRGAAEALVNETPFPPNPPLLPRTPAPPPPAAMPPTGLR